MKELEQPLKLQPEQAIIRQVEQEKHYKLVGSAHIKPGHRLYVVNWYTREVVLVTPETLTAKMLLNGKVETKKRVMLMADHFYTSAMNAANALRHYIRAINH